MPDLAQLARANGIAADLAQPGQATAAFARRDIKCLTALRFYPALAVVFYHAREYFTCWQSQGDSVIFGQAVGFFFVLSGFILTLNYFNLNDFKGACQFYLARLARIWPAHAFTLIVLVALMPELFKIKGAHMPLFLTNLCMLHSWIPSWRIFFSYNAPGWSNSTEICFYLCFPLMLFAMRKAWLLPIAISATILGALILFCNSAQLPEWSASGLSAQGLLYIHPLARLFEFTVGMVTALIWMRSVSKVRIGVVAGTLLEALALLAVVYINIHSGEWRYQSVSWAGTSGAFWTQNSGLAVLGFAALFFVFACEQGLLSRKLFSMPLLVLLGELSFGMYMLHCVLLAYRSINFPLDTSVGGCILFWATLMVGTHLMFVAVERPLRKGIIKVGNSLLAKKFGEQPRKSTTGGAKRPKLARLGLVAEALLFAGLVYAALPTVHPISAAEASSVIPDATVRNVDFQPFLRCLKASAVANGKTITVNLLWQTLQDGSPDNSIMIDALSASGTRVGGVTYAQEMRHKQLAAGMMWRDKFDIQTKAPAHELLVKVVRARRKVIMPGIPSARNAEAMMVPVTAN